MKSNNEQKGKGTVLIHNYQRNKEKLPTEKFNANSPTCTEKDQELSSFYNYYNSQRASGECSFNNNFSYAFEGKNIKKMPYKNLSIAFQKELILVGIPKQKPIEEDNKIIDNNINSKEENDVHNEDDDNALQSEDIEQIENDKKENIDHQVIEENSDRTKSLLEKQLEYIMGEYHNIKVMNQFIKRDSKELDNKRMTLDKEINNQSNIREKLLNEFTSMNTQLEQQYHSLTQKKPIRLKNKIIMPPVNNTLLVKEKEKGNLIKMVKIIKKDVKHNKTSVQQYNNPEETIAKATQVLEALSIKRLDLENTISQLKKIRDIHMKCNNNNQKSRNVLKIYQNEYEALRNPPKSNRLESTRSSNKSQNLNITKRAPDTTESRNLSKHSSMPILKSFQKMHEQTTKNKGIIYYSVKRNHYKNDLSLFKEEEKKLLEQFIPQKHLIRIEDRFMIIENDRKTLDQKLNQETEYYKNTIEKKDSENQLLIKKNKKLHFKNRQLEKELKIDQLNIINVKKRIKEITKLLKSFQEGLITQNEEINTKRLLVTNSLENMDPIPFNFREEEGTQMSPGHTPVVTIPS